MLCLIMNNLILNILINFVHFEDTSTAQKSSLVLQPEIGHSLSTSGSAVAILKNKN